MNKFDQHLDTTCPYCGRSSAIRKDGCYMQHTRYSPVGDVPCEASGHRADDERFRERAQPFRLAADAADALGRCGTRILRLEQEIAGRRADLPRLTTEAAKAADALARWDAEHPGPAEAAGADGGAR